MIIKHHCTGTVSIDGFDQFLKSEISEPRRNIKLFQKELKEKFEVDGYITLVNSGSSANLTAALASRELTGKSMAVASGFTFPTTVSSILFAGYGLKLIDADEFNFGISEDSLINSINDNTGLVFATNFLGFPLDIEVIEGICQRYGVILIQDSCETMNPKAGSKRMSDFGDMMTWSFYHPHHLSSYGGGAVITRDKKVREIVESVSHWGRECSCHYDSEACTAPEGENHNFWYKRMGINVEMSELNACFGRFQLLSWDEQELKRMNNYRKLYNLFTEFVATDYRINAPANFSPFVFPVVPQSKQAADKIKKLLYQSGIEYRTLMGGAISNHPAFSHLETDGLHNIKSRLNNAFFIGIHQTIQDFDEYLSALKHNVLEKLSNE